MAIRDYIPLNFALMANPYNWLVIALMVAIAGAGLAFIVSSAPNNNEV
jgi:predicted membrane channel-forming protein YqfA (hemolysin III family)